MLVFLSVTRFKTAFIKKFIELRMIQKRVKPGADILLIFCLIFFAGFIRCSTYNPAKPEGGTTPEISDLFAPSVVYYLSSIKYSISVQAEDPQGLDDLAEVQFEIIKSGLSTPVISGVLLDDGTSGDVIPKDGRFTTQIQGSLFQNDTGEFNLEIIATDKNGNISNSLQTRIFVLAGAENNLPEIINVSVPATVPIDSLFEFLIEVEVSDADGLADIEFVLLQFFPPAHPNPTRQDTLLDNGLSGDVTPGDGIYSTRLSSSLINELSDYFLRFQAEDSAGNKSQPVIVSVHGRLKSIGVPEITEVGVPRMVNANDVNQVLISADVSDPQGLSDIDSVLYSLFLPSGQEAQNSPQIMADDGDVATSGDTTAGDGRFSSVLQLQGGDGDPIDFTLIFQAKDKSNVLSATVESRLVVAFTNAPFISNLIAPSSVQINPNQETKILITLDVRDPQGISDIAMTQFRSFLPSGDEANNSPIELFDNGDQDIGDQKAGDGIYSRFIFLPPTGVTPGDFRFVFEATDNSGLKSNSIAHIMNVSQ